MSRVVMVLLLLGFLGMAHVLLLDNASESRRVLPQPLDSGYVLPSPILRVISGEFRGLVADIYFLQGLVAYGRTLERRIDEPAKEQVWQHVFCLLDAATDLDPYFFDPYYFANASLGRNPTMVPKINTMLEKGVLLRDWDWMLPFFLGFNNFYYLQDNAKAAEYLMLGARRPDAIPLLVTLAARLAYRDNRTENAIVFLRSILNKAKDKKTHELFKTRLEALEKILYLERAVAYYRQKFGYGPNELKDLVNCGILTGLPEDPYGGAFFMAEDGSIQSTSDLTPAEGAK